MIKVVFGQNTVESKQQFWIKRKEKQCVSYINTFVKACLKTKPVKETEGLDKASLQISIFLEGNTL